MFPLQEAAALSELEERMKSSNHLLAKKEHALNQLQASLTQQVRNDVVNPLKGNKGVFLVALCVH